MGFAHFIDGGFGLLTDDSLELVFTLSHVRHPEPCR
jgi:hypothetical protein